MSSNLALMRSFNSAAAASVKVFAIRKDGFNGPIKLSFKDLPEGFESGGATLAANAEVVGLALKTTLEETEEPVNLTVVGSATLGDQEIVNEAVPADDIMQAFLWRHLQPAETLPALVTNPSWKPSADRVRPEIRKRVARWTGEYQFALDQVLKQLIGRCRELELRAVGSERALRTDFAILLTVHTVNYVYRGREWHAV